MMEKQNRTISKDAAGDAGVLDDLVDFASKRFEKVRQTDPKARRNQLSGKNLAVDAPIDPAR